MSEEQDFKQLWKVTEEKKIELIQFYKFDESNAYSVLLKVEKSPENYPIESFIDGYGKKVPYIVIMAFVESEFQKRKFPISSVRFRNALMSAIDKKKNFPQLVKLQRLGTGVETTWNVIKEAQMDTTSKKSTKAKSD